MTRRYRSFKSEVAKRPPSGEPADSSEWNNRQYMQNHRGSILFCRKPSIRRRSSAFLRIALLLLCGNSSVSSRWAASDRSFQQILNGFRSHAGFEIIAIQFAVFKIVFSLRSCLGSRITTRVGDDPGYSTNLFQGFRHIKHQTHATVNICRTNLLIPVPPTQVLCVRRTFDWVTSTPQRSQTTPLCLKRLYLPQLHSQSCVGPKIRSQKRPPFSGLKER